MTNLFYVEALYKSIILQINRELHRVLEVLALQYQPPTASDVKANDYQGKAEHNKKHNITGTEDVSPGGARFIGRAKSSN